MYKRLSKKLAMIVFVLLQMVLVVNFTHAADWYPMDSGTEEDLYGVWGSSATDVFAVGDSGTILHYDGTQWSLMDSGADEYTTLYGIWGFSATDVYVGGYGPTLLHYDGLAWSSLPWVLEAPDDRVLDLTSFKYIWGDSPTSLFIGGEQYTGGFFGRFDGDHLYPIPKIHESEVDYSFDVKDVWGISSTDIYIPDGSPYYGYIWHYDGTACYTSLRTEVENEDNTFYSIWGSAADDVFAAIKQWYQG